MISERLKSVILRELGLASFDIQDSTLAMQVPGWDSLNHVRVMAAVEEEFKIRFRTLEILPLTREFDYRRSLARGEADLVIGNWLAPPEELHLGRLLADEVVCLVAADHPAVTHARSWTAERYLAAQHIAPTPMSAGAQGVIDEQLAAQGLAREIAVRTPHFGLAPLMVARSRLVLTTGRLFCTRYLDTLPLRIVSSSARFTE